ncbi:hypothetical protein [Luteimonas mephitis]|uniref:hypothetical protein n=1 Tax=Luteimonas mephitis TaxID=83615 RepID=UPI003A955D15
MNKVFLLILLLPLVACNRGDAPDSGMTQTPLPTAVAESPAAPEVIRPKPESVPEDLKAPLPEGFELPFAYHRLYDNTGKTDSGSPQRRVMVEFLGTDLMEARVALTQALAAKGFGAPKADQLDGLERLTFARQDGASVIAKFDGQPKALRMRSQDAKGTLHLTWNAP